MKRHLIIFCLLLTNQAAAQSIHSGKQYNIELLVFQNLAPSDNGESWPVDTTALEDEQAEPLDAEFAEQARPVHWLKRNQLHLNQQAGAVARSAGYRKLALYAWRQVVLDRNLATPMTLPASTPTRTGAWVDGTVMVSVGRYLHLDLDLEFHQQQAAQALELQAYETPEFRLVEQRRMRSQELHYFDHPRFAVIAIITRHEEPESQTGDTSED